MEDNTLGMKLKAEAALQQVKEERLKRIRQYWENGLPKFKEPHDVPTLPRASETEWKEFYVPKLIEAGAIPKKDLVIGRIYVGDHRRTNCAKWTGENFVYRRYDFGSFYDDYCNHFEDDDGFALFVPIKEGTEEDYDKN